MLILSREANQSLMIGDDLQLEVVRIRGASANLRITRRLIGGRLTEEVFCGWLEKDRQVKLTDKIACAVVQFASNPTQVRIGIEAPREVSIHRKEVYDAIRRTQS
jgi:carbon storage regulator CsrA